MEESLGYQCILFGLFGLYRKLVDQSVESLNEKQFLFIYLTLTLPCYPEYET